MAFVYKSADSVNKPAPSYLKLAKLKLAADSGDVVAALKLTQLGPAAERLAGHLVDLYKNKPSEPAITKAAKSPAPQPAPPRRPTLEDMLRADLHSPDPAIRLTAERALKAL